MYFVYTFFHVLKVFLSFLFHKIDSHFRNTLYVCTIRIVCGPSGFILHGKNLITFEILYL